MTARHSLEIFALSALVLMGTAMRVQNLSEPFFYDEAVYVNLAQHPFHSDFYDDRIFFRHPPAHYLILAAFGSLWGYSEVMMRLPSVVFAAATILLIYFLGHRLASREVALLAAALLTFNVLHQQYAQAATMYSLFTFLLTLCVYGFVCGDERLVACGFIGAIYTHYFGFYLAPPLLLILLSKMRWGLEKNRRRIGALPHCLPAVDDHFRAGIRVSCQPYRRPALVEFPLAKRAQTTISGCVYRRHIFSGRAAKTTDNSAGDAALRFFSAVGLLSYSVPSLPGPVLALPYRARSCWPCGASQAIQQ